MVSQIEVSQVTKLVTCESYKLQNEKLLNLLTTVNNVQGTLFEEGAVELI